MSDGVNGVGGAFVITLALLELGLAVELACHTSRLNTVGPIIVSTQPRRLKIAVEMW